MTQKATVRRTLEAHPEGVRSDYFFALHIPRAAARVQELKNEGVPIDTKREGKYVRWTLARVRTIEGRTRKECLIEPSVEGSPDSGEGCAVGRAEPPRGSQGAGNATYGGTSPVPSMFDYDADWSDAA